MFSYPRRKALKFLSVSTAAATGLSANLQVFASSFDKAIVNKIPSSAPTESEFTDITDVVFNIEERGFFGRSTLLVSNRSETETTLTHVYPGIVNAGGKTFDLNSPLQNGPIKLPAKGSLRIAVRPIKGPATEKSIPKGLTYSQPVTVATPLNIAHDRVKPQHTKIRTLRTYFS